MPLLLDLYKNFKGKRAMILLMDNYVFKCYYFVCLLGVIFKLINYIPIKGGSFLDLTIERLVFNKN